jgi:hypothetical protein
LRDAFNGKLETIWATDRIAAGRLASFLILLAGFGGYAFAFYRSLDLLDKLDLSEDFQKK